MHKIQIIAIANEKTELQVVPSDLGMLGKIIFTEPDGDRTSVEMVPKLFERLVCQIQKIHVSAEHFMTADTRVEISKFVLRRLVYMMKSYTKEYGMDGDDWAAIMNYVEDVDKEIAS